MTLVELEIIAIEIVNGHSCTNICSIRDYMPILIKEAERSHPNITAEYPEIIECLEDYLEVRKKNCEEAFRKAAYAARKK